MGENIKPLPPAPPKTIFNEKKKKKKDKAGPMIFTISTPVLVTPSPEQVTAVLSQQPSDVDKKTTAFRNSSLRAPGSPKTVHKRGSQQLLLQPTPAQASPRTAKKIAWTSPEPAAATPEAAVTMRLKPTTRPTVPSYWSDSSSDEEDKADIQQQAARAAELTKQHQAAAAQSQRTEQHAAQQAAKPKPKAVLTLRPVDEADETSETDPTRRPTLERPSADNATPRTQVTAVQQERKTTVRRSHVKVLDDAGSLAESSSDVTPKAAASGPQRTATARRKETPRPPSIALDAVRGEEFA